MKYFEGRITYPQFLKYLAPSVLTMIFLSFYTTKGHTCHQSDQCKGKGIFDNLIFHASPLLFQMPSVRSDVR